MRYEASTTPRPPSRILQSAQQNVSDAKAKADAKARKTALKEAKEELKATNAALRDAKREMKQVEKHGGPQQLRQACALEKKALKAVEKAEAKVEKLS